MNIISKVVYDCLDEDPLVPTSLKLHRKTVGAKIYSEKGILHVEIKGMNKIEHIEVSP